MNPMEKSGWTPFPNSEEAVKQARTVPQTPQTEAPAYRLAFMDDEFMTRRDLRPIRLQLELLKPEMILADRGIKSTVVMFGARAFPSRAARHGLPKMRFRRRTFRPIRIIMKKRANSRGSARNIPQPPITANSSW